MDTPPTDRPGHTGGSDGAARRCLNEVLAGDEAALGRLLALCWDSVVSYAASITGGTDSAEDIAQDTFCRIWSGRSDFRARGEASVGLIYRIARNLALNHHRAGTRRERHLSIYRETHDQTPDLDPGWAERIELRTAVEAAVAALPARRREVFTLARFHGLSHAEIAETMDISPQTVANQMSAALDTLRRTLGRFLPPSTPAVDRGRAAGGRDA